MRYKLQRTEVKRVCDWRRWRDGEKKGNYYVCSGGTFIRGLNSPFHCTFPTQFEIGKKKRAAFADFDFAQAPLVAITAQSLSKYDAYNPDTLIFEAASPLAFRKPLWLNHGELVASA